MAKKKRSPARKDSPASTPNSNGRALPWPWLAGLRQTPIRLKWHRRLAALSPGLSLGQIAEQLGEPYPSVAFWAKLLGYAFTRQRRGRKSQVDWERVDWGLRNCDIARQVGVSGERVRQVRLAGHFPSPPRLSDGGLVFHAFVRKNRRQLHRMSIREMLTASGARISLATAHAILKQVKSKGL